MAENNKSILDYDDIIKKTDAFDVLFVELDKFEKKIKRIAKLLQKDLQLINPNDTKAIQNHTKEVAKLERANAKLKAEKEKAVKARKKLIDLTNEELIALQKEKAAVRERNAIAKQTAIIQANGAKSIAGLRAQLSLTTIQWKKLTAEEATNTKKGKDLVATKLSLTKRLKALEKATDDNRRSVGKYSDALGGLGKTAARVFLGRTAVDFFRRIATGTLELIEKNKEGSESLTELSNSIEGATGALEGAAVKILTVLAPALTFLANTVIGVIDFFFDLEDEAGNLSVTSEELKGKTDELSKEFGKEKGQLDSLFSSLQEANKGSEKRKGIIDEINTQYGQYLPNLLTEKSSLEDIAAAQDLINESLSKTFLLRAQQATQLDIFTNKANKTIDVFNQLKEQSIFPLETSLSEFETFISTLSKNQEARQLFENYVSTARQTLGDGFTEVNKEAIDAIVKGQIQGLDDLQKGLGGFVSKFGALGLDELNLIKTLVGDTGQFNEAIEETNGAIKSLESSLVTFDRTTAKSSTTAAKNTKEVTSKRLEAIEQLLRDVEKAEVENIKAKQERLLALEDLRFKELQRLTLIRLQELQEASKNNNEELAKIQEAGQKLSEEQLKEHEQNKLDIRRENGIKAIEIERLNLEELEAERAKIREQEKKLLEQQTGVTEKSIKETQKAVQKANEQAIKDKQDRVAKEKELTKELLNDINKLSVESSKVIQEVFSNQAKASAKAVEEQLNAVEQAEERARLGLTNNLKFEQEQLAKRQAEQQRALKAQKQAADALALVQLTIAAAQNGDPKAVATAVTQFGILKGLEAAITGSFFEGTEDTGKGGNMDIRKGMLSILHPHERVVSRRENEQLKGISNKELPTFANIGRDFLEGNLTLDASHFRGQAHDISPVVLKKESNKEVINELKEVKRAIKSIPVVDTKIEELYGKVLEFSKKTTNRHVSRIEKTRVSL